jgi:hypothetical protein
VLFVVVLIPLVVVQLLTSTLPFLYENSPSPSPILIQAQLLSYSPFVSLLSLSFSKYFLSPPFPSLLPPPFSKPPSQLPSSPLSPYPLITFLPSFIASSLTIFVSSAKAS